MPSWGVVLAALAAIGLQVVPSRDAGTARQGSASIKGRVVDGTTKAPLPRARVRLSGSSQRGPVLTDDGGAFAFSGLPAGTYSFVIERNGYLSASWPDSSRWIRRREGALTLAATDRLEDVTLAIYDANGHLVRTLVNEVQGYGAHEVTWDGRDDDGAAMGSGVYFYRLRAGKLTESKKMVLLK